MVKIVKRVLEAEQLLIKKIAAETTRLIKDDGANIISLSQGVPNLPIFQAARDAMIDLISTMKLPYTDVPGELQARTSVANFVNKLYQREELHLPEFNPSHVLITSGAIQAVYNSLAISIESPQDVVASPLPAYGLYKHQTKILGGTFEPIPTSSSTAFIPTIEDLEHFFNKFNGEEGHGKVRALVLCFPNNPAGTVLSPEQAKAISLFLDKKLEQAEKEGDDGFSLILDEVYVGITRAPFDPQTSILTHASPRLLQNIFFILSASKGLGAMPGARAGVCLSFNTQATESMVKVQTACSGNSSIISQSGLRSSFDFLSSHPETLLEISNYYLQRATYATQRLNLISKKHLNGAIVAREPSATFYVLADFSSFPSSPPEDEASTPTPTSSTPTSTSTSTSTSGSKVMVSELGRRIQTDVDLQVFFRDMYKNGKEKTGVAVVPGSAFGIPPESKHIRFSCAVEMHVLQQAFDILEEAFELLLPTSSTSTSSPSN